MDILKSILDKFFIPLIISIVPTLFKINITGRKEIECPKKKDSLAKYLWYIFGIISLPLVVLVSYVLIFVIMFFMFGIELQIPNLIDINMYSILIIYWVCTIVITALLDRDKITFVKYKKKKIDNSVLNKFLLLVPLLINSILMTIYVICNYRYANIMKISALSMIIFEILGFVFLDDNKKICSFVDLKLKTYRYVDIPVNNFAIGRKWVSIKRDNGVEKIKRDDIVAIYYHNDEKDKY